MTVFRPGTNIIDGPFYNLTGGDDVLVRRGINLVSLTVEAITAAGSGHVVTVNGTVDAQDATAIILGTLIAGTTGNRLVVGEDGHVSGPFNGLVSGPFSGLIPAAIVFGSGNVLENAGRISGLVGFVFAVDGGQTATMENSGTIFAGAGIVRADGAGVSRLINTGTINGLEGAYLGEFAGSNVARDIVDNRGIMRGNVLLGDGNDLYDGSKGGRVFGTIEGGGGNDRFLMGAKAENVNGFTDVDIVDYSRATGSVKLALDAAFDNTGWATGDIFNNIDQVKGSRFNDTIRGSLSSETLMGADGNDRIIGGNGLNFIVGGKGLDVLSGGSDTDFFQFNRLADLGDRITNFNATSDAIFFKVPGLGLTGFGPAMSEFRTRADNQAQDADDRFIFRTTDKSLWFDRDGAGGSGPVLVADLQQSATMTHQDISYELF